MNENKDSYTIEDVLHIMLFGTDEEKEKVLAAMIYAMNAKLDHLIWNIEMKKKLNEKE